MITKYGYDVFFTVVTLCAVIIVLSALFVEPKIPRYAIILISGAFLVLTVNFFRDPERVTPTGERNIVSPADGEIIVIKEVEEAEFLKSRAIQISVFMSPLNVHVNRNPISGSVRHVRYVKGEYFAAFEDKASERNEQSIVGIENEHGRLMFKQIAGFLARRIVCPLKIGDAVNRGERFGMIKFGSRVDVFVPSGTAIRVKVGDHAVAGESILAEFAQ
jgi:phosphatidylserine decarboxylase